MAAVYVPRSRTTGVLYRVVRTHLTGFLAAVRFPYFRDIHPGLPYRFTPTPQPHTLARARPWAVATAGYRVAAWLAEQA